MKFYFAILCSIFWLDYSFSSHELSTISEKALHKEASSNISIANVNKNVDTSTTQVAASGDVPLKFEITDTRTKSSNYKNIARELLEEIKKDTEQRKNSTTSESRERKITKTDNKQLAGAKLNTESISNASIAASPSDSTAAVTSTTSPKPNVQQAHKLVADGVEMGDTQTSNLTTKPTSTNGQAAISGAKSTTQPDTLKLVTANTSHDSTPSSISTTPSSTILPSKSVTSTTLRTMTARTTTEGVMTPTTTANHTKPKITYSMDTHPELEDALLTKQPNNKPDSRLIPTSTAASASSATKTTSTASTIVNQPTQYEPPHVQPSQERISNVWSPGPSNDYIVPIFTVLVTIPLAIGVVMIMYRRLREFWSTRHYHRMDFLVDGMYND